MNFLNEMRGFTDPHLHCGKEWYVDFYAFDPGQDCMRRKKFCVPTGLGLRERKAKAAEMIFELQRKLHDGWSPWYENAEYSRNMPFEDCMNSYLDNVNPENRKVTKSSYRSHISVLRAYNNSRKYPVLYAKGFTTAFCSEFLGWLVETKHVSMSTRNSYLAWLNCFANYMLTKQMIDVNPVSAIRKVRVYGKRRKDFDATMLASLRDFLLAHDKHFYLACLMEYYTFIRPAEMRMLQVGAISADRKSLFVSGDFSKNHRNGFVGLNVLISELMDELDIFNQPESYYIFSTDFAPGKNILPADSFNRKWKSVREELGWDDCYQFYSLKDSGIRDLAHSCGLNIAMEQARHSSVVTTKRYIQSYVPNSCTLDFHGGLDLGKTVPVTPKVSGLKSFIRKILRK